MPGMPMQQIPLNFEQETAEEKLARLKSTYQETFGQAADLMGLDAPAIEAALQDIEGHKAAIWEHNRSEDEESRQRPGFHQN